MYVYKGLIVSCGNGRSEPPSMPPIPLRSRHRRSVLGPTQFDILILVYLVMYDSGKVFLEHLLLPWYPSRGLLGLMPLWMS